MSGFLASTASILGRTVLSPLAPHSLFAVNVEHARANAPSPAPRSTTSDPPSSQSEATRHPSIESLLAATPSLDPAKAPAYRPTPWLSTGHLQTIYCAVASFDKIDPVEYKRRVFLTPDGGTVALDISPPALAPSEFELATTNHDAASGVPTVVCLHGLTGGSHESYVRNCFSQLTRPKQHGGAGYRGVVVNFRGCANVPVTSPQLYSASKTSDLRSALLLLTRLYPNSPLVGIGFSLGANVLGKYLGEEGDASPLLAGILVGTPFDLKAGSDALEYGGFLPQKYSAAMNSNLTKVVRRHKDTLALHPPFRPHLDYLFDPDPISKEDAQLHREQCQRGGPGADEREVIRPATLKLVDETMVRLLGGHAKPYGEFPFASANDYYRHGGCVHFLDGVRRPLLCLNAEDDPIVPASIWKDVRRTIGYDAEGRPLSEAERTAQGVRLNEHIALAWTKGGGHLGWFEGIRPKRWLYKPVSEFVQAVFEQTSDERKREVAARTHLWKQDGRVLAREVEIELMPAEALPVYDLPGENGRPRRNGEPRSPEANGDGDERPPPTVRDDTSGDAAELRVAELAKDLQDSRAGAASALLNPSDVGADPDSDPLEPHSTSRLAWLLTHVLPHAPLIHPRHAPNGRFHPPAADQAEPARDAQGWKLLRGQTMYCDTQRAEVGFLELDEHSRVAGSGQTFRGGVETPGHGALHGGSATRQNGVIAGL